MHISHMAHVRSMQKQKGVQKSRATQCLEEEMNNGWDCKVACNISKTYFTLHNVA